MNKFQVKSLAKNTKTNLDLVQILVEYFGIEITTNLLEMKKSEIKNVVRVNLAKTTRNEVLFNLSQIGVKGKTMNEISEGIVITKGWEKVGYSLPYMKGEIMPQGLGSMLAVDVLDPQPDENILDMSAAPGGKSCFIGERLKGRGKLIVNDLSKKRSSALINNLTRHGINNFQLTNNDASTYTFDNIDKILLDAPCSGDGLIISQTTRRKSKSVMNSYAMQKVQFSLLRNAARNLSTDGICVYSTCALTPIENEMVIKQVLDKFEIQEINIPGDDGFVSLGEPLRLTRRLLPSKLKCDGFFIAKLRKI